MDVIPDATRRRLRQSGVATRSVASTGLLEGKIRGLVVRGGGPVDRMPRVFCFIQTRGFKCLVFGLLVMNFVEKGWICLILMHVKVHLKGR